jgi:Uma2 family endonuclease
MATLIQSSELEERLRAERRATGADRWDEVWEGVYVMAPYPNNEHQVIQAKFVTILQTVVGWEGGDEVCAGVNVSDREVDWRQNFRCPDVALFLRGTRAANRGAFWLGGPDFAVEIVSPEDSSRDKLEFYAKVGVRELLIVDRAPWQLEFYRLEAGRLVSAVRSSAAAGGAVGAAHRSDVVPLSFWLSGGGARQVIEVMHHDGIQRWRI